MCLYICGWVQVVSHLLKGEHPKGRVSKNTCREGPTGHSLLGPDRTRDWSKSLVLFLMKWLVMVEHSAFRIHLKRRPSHCPPLWAQSQPGAVPSPGGAVGEMGVVWTCPHTHTPHTADGLSPACFFVCKWVATTRNSSRSFLPYHLVIFDWEWMAQLERGSCTPGKLIARSLLGAVLYLFSLLHLTFPPSIGVES